MKKILLLLGLLFLLLPVKAQIRASAAYNKVQAVAGDVTAPTLDSAEIGRVGNDLIYLFFDEGLHEDSVPVAGDFSITGIATTPAITTIEIFTDTVLLTLDDTAADDDVILIDYTKPATGTLEDVAENEVASWTNSSVTNYVLPPAGGYGAAFQAVYDAWTNKPHDSIAAKLNTFVETLVASGTWAKLDRLHIYAIHTANNSDALIDWITAGNSATAVSAPVFTAFEGYVGDAGADYIDWEWAPSDGVNYTQNSASIGVYIRVADYGTTKHVMGSYDNSYASFILPRSDDNEAKWYHNQGSTQTVVSNSSPTGLFILQRTASNADQLFRNKASLGTSSVVSEGRSTQDIFSLATNWDNPGAAFFCDYQIAMDFAGSALTQTDIDTITDAFETYMDSNVKGIIP